jgi:hypothetical protein
MSFELLIEILQYGSFIGPIVGGVIAYRTCVLLKNTNAHPIQRPVGGIMTRDAHGGYHTVGHEGGEGHDGDGHEGNGHGGNGHGGNGHDGEAALAPTAGAHSSED